jgi:hypothetical protein
MDTEPTTGGKQKYFLTAEAILKYLLATDDKIDTLITCKPDGVDITTSDYNVYEAMGSIVSEDNVQLNRLTKFLEVVDVVSHRQTQRQEKPILKEERVAALREHALGANPRGK